MSYKSDIEIAREAQKKHRFRKSVQSLIFPLNIFCLMAMIRPRLAKNLSTRFKRMRAEN